MDSKRVNRIPQRYKTIVNGYVKDTYYNIADLIKHMILLYFVNTMESKILSNDEHDQFRNLLIENQKFIVDNECKLIYRQSEEIVNGAHFRQKVFGKSNVLILIESENGNVIGGYTKTGWDKDFVGYGHSTDKNAFIFQIRSSKGYKPFISNIKQSDDSMTKAIGYGFNQWVQFGYTWIFSISFDIEDSMKVYHSNNEPDNSYEPFPVSDNYPMLGGKREDEIANFEVFQMLG